MRRSGGLPLVAALAVVLGGCSQALGGAEEDEADGRGLLSEVDPAEVGMDPQALGRLDAVLDSALEAGAAPGASLAIGRRGKLVRLRGYGVLDPADGAGVTPETIYDLASLTKVVGTTTAVMMLVDQGELSLDDRVVDLLPWWAEGDERKAEVTLRQLLTHTAGLTPFRRWFLEIQGKEAYRAAIAAEPLEWDPGTRTAYSDIGVMTVALMIEEASGMPLDRFLDERLFRVLGMTDTGFNPDPSELPRIAPTEVDADWRGEHVRGVVHDENADAYGGVAGHAGLFSTARDLAAFADLLLKDGRMEACEPAAPGAPCLSPRRGAEQLLQPATVEDFTRRQSDASTRALGWDTPSERSSAGDYFSDRAFGHTGFTGTSIWMDPERDLFVVLLTNRVNPTRENSRHVPLRRTVHDLAVQAIVDEEIEPRPGSPAWEARQ